MPICSEIGSFEILKCNVHKLVTDERVDRRADEENVMHLPSLDCHTDK